MRTVIFYDNVWAEISLLGVSPYFIYTSTCRGQTYFVSGTFSAPSAVCVNIEKKAVTAYIGTVITIVFSA